MTTKTSLKEIEQQLEGMIRDFLNSENASEPLPPEIVVFAKTRLALNDQQIRAERRRIREVMQHQASVCCPVETAKLQEQLEEAQQKLRTDGPQIEQQIAELSRKLQQLQQAPTRISAQLEESEVAKAKLERCLPNWANRERQQIHKENEQLLSNRNELKTGIDHLKHVLANPNDVDVFHLYQQSVTRLLVDVEADSVRDLGKLLREEDKGWSTRLTIGPEVLDHLDKIREALPTLEQHLEELNAEVDECIETPIRDLRCMYHN